MRLRVRAGERAEHAKRRTRVKPVIAAAAKPKTISRACHAGPARYGSQGSRSGGEKCQTGSATAANAAASK